MLTAVKERLPALDKESAPAESQPVLGQVEKIFGSIPNVFRTMANSPATLKAFWQVASLRYTLPARLREAVSIAVSQEDSCGYCLAAHTATGQKAGLSPAEAEGVRRGGLSDPKEQAIIDLARTIVRDRGAVSDEVIDKCHAAGVSNRELAEVVTVVSLTIYSNYFNRFAHTAIDFPAVPNMPEE